MKLKVPYEELKTMNCEKGGKHNVWLSLTGDGHPAFCSKCGNYSHDVPPEEYEDL